jgi:hypothetical protein
MQTPPFKRFADVARQLLKRAKIIETGSKLETMSTREPRYKGM